MVDSLLNEKIARDVVRIDSSRNFRMLNKLMVISGLGYTFDAIAIALIAFILPVVIAPFHLSGIQSGVLGASTLIGYFVGATFWGLVGDKYGRKQSIQYTLIIYAIFSLLSAFSTNFSELTIFRIIAGFGIGGESAVIAPYFSEFVPRKFRGRYTGMLTGFFSFGFIISAFLGYFLVPIPNIGWRIASVITALPIFYVIVLRFRLPESPRWLRLHGKDAEADSVLNTITGSTELPAEIDGKPVETYMSEIVKVLSNARRGNSFKQIWSKAYRKRTSMLWILWFTTGFAYYGFFVFVPTLLVDRGYTLIKTLSMSLLIFIMQFPGYYSAAFFIERFGRKTGVTTYMIGGAIAAILLSQSSTTLEIIILASAMSWFLNGLFGGVYIYTPEQYPTDFRTSGMGYASSFARIGAIISPIAFGILAVSIHFSGVFVISFIVMLFGAISVLILGTETKDKDLERTGSASEAL